MDNTIQNSSENEIAEEMYLKCAKWHHSCRSKHNEQKLKRHQQAECKRMASEDVNLSPVKTRRSFLQEETVIDENAEDGDAAQDQPCLICNEKKEKRWGGCHKAATFGVHQKVWEAAKITRDTKLLASLSAGDMIAIDAVYHLRCLVKLYKSAEAQKEGSVYTNEAEMQQIQAYVEIQEFVETYRGSSEVISMSYINKMYQQRLKQLDVEKSSHTTRLRESLVSSIPDLTCVKNKSGTWDLLFDESLAAAVVELKQHDTASDKISILSRAGKLVRDAILKAREGAQDVLSQSLTTIVEELRLLLHFIMNNHSILSAGEDMKATENAIASLGQIIQFNTVSRRRAKTSILRHSKQSLTPYPLYKGIKTYLVSGKNILDAEHAAGITPSYDFIKQFATDIANTLIAKWKDMGVVLPPNAVKGVLTVCGFDNVDWNAKNPLAQLLSTLHGTILIVHQFVERDEPYQMIEIAKNQSGKKTAQELPESYTKVDYSKMYDDQYRISKHNQGPVKVQNLGLDGGKMLEETILEPQKQWLADTKVLVQKKKLDADDYVSWGAYFASKSSSPESPNMTSSALPIHLEKASDPAMVYKVSMLCVGITEALNPGQTPWLETDEPLYAGVKKVQQKYPELGEDKMLVTLGGIHSEKMLWSASGEFVNGSGYTAVLTASGICSSGIAESIITVSNILRARWVKQVFVVTIDRLKQLAYLQYLEKTESTTEATAGVQNLPETEETSNSNKDSQGKWINDPSVDHIIIYQLKLIKHTILMLETYDLSIYLVLKVF